MHNAHAQPPVGDGELLTNDVLSECAPAIHEQLQQVEELTNELKRLLVTCETTLDAEGIKQQIEALERWAESYRRGIKAAGKISLLGPAWLTDLRGRLKNAADEMTRLTNEGGVPMTKEQVATSEQLLRATKKIDDVLPNIENLARNAGASESAEEEQDK